MDGTRFPIRDPSETYRVSELSLKWIENKDFLFKISLSLNRGNIADSEDLLSNVLLKILSNTNCSVETIRNPQAFFSDILHKEFCSGYRRSKRLVRLRVEPASPGEEFPERTRDRAPSQFDRIAGKERMRIFIEGFEKLPTAQRRALEMRAFQGCAYREIAAHLHISPALARKRVQLARSTIRSLLERADALSADKATLSQTATRSVEEGTAFFRSDRG